MTPYLLYSSHVCTCTCTWSECRQLRSEAWHRFPVAIQAFLVTKRKNYVHVCVLATFTGLFAYLQCLSPVCLLTSNVCPPPPRWLSQSSASEVCWTAKTAGMPCQDRCSQGGHGLAYVAYSILYSGTAWDFECTLSFFVMSFVNSSSSLPPLSSLHYLPPFPSHLSFSLFPPPSPSSS